MTAGMVSCMLLCWGVVFADLVILASSPYSSELLVPGGGWSAFGVLLCVRVCIGPAHLVFMEVMRSKHRHAV